MIDNGDGSWLLWAAASTDLDIDWQILQECEGSFDSDAEKRWAFNFDAKDEANGFQ